MLLSIYIFNPDDNLRFFLFIAHLSSRCSSQAPCVSKVWSPLSQSPCLTQAVMEGSGWTLTTTQWPVCTPSHPVWTWQTWAGTGRAGWWWGTWAPVYLGWSWRCTGAQHWWARAPCWTCLLALSPSLWTCMSHVSLQWPWPLDLVSTSTKTWDPTLSSLCPVWRSTRWSRSGHIRPHTGEFRVVCVRIWSFNVLPCVQTRADCCCSLIDQDVWQQVREGQIDPLTLKEMLESIKNKADVPLSVCSLRFLSLDTSDMDEYVQLHKQQPVRRQVTSHQIIDDDDLSYHKNTIMYLWLCTAAIMFFVFYHIVIS